eukprot:13993684-Heterocapsa_arctica.AAC.1
MDVESSQAKRTINCAEDALEGLGENRKRTMRENISNLIRIHKLINAVGNSLVSATLLMKSN